MCLCGCWGVERQVGESKLGKLTVMLTEVPEAEGREEGRGELSVLRVSQKKSQELKPNLRIIT